MNQFLKSEINYKMEKLSIKKQFNKRKHQKIQKKVTLKSKKHRDHKHKHKHKRTRKHIHNSIRNIIAHQQNWICKWCKQFLPAAFEIDHICPLHLKGANSRYNYQALCGTCHNRKSQWERINRDVTKQMQFSSSSVKWCAYCETIYSTYFPHTWHYTSL